MGKGRIRGEITQQGVIFRNRKSAKGRKPRKKDAGASNARQVEGKVWTQACPSPLVKYC